MKILSLRPSAALIGAALAGAFLASTAQAREFTFSQDGFAEGATVTGTFRAFDMDGDGQISSFDGEVNGFTMSFSGNSIVPAFSADFAGLFGLVYDLGSGGLGDGLALDVEGALGFDATFSYVYATGQGPTLADGGLVQDLTNLNFSDTLSVAQVTEVPVVPDAGSTLGLLALAGSALALTKRRR